MYYGNMIYFIKQNKTSPIRIGITNNIEERLQELQAGSLGKLVCLKTVQTENDQQAEDIIFTFFHNSRIDQSGWFSSTRVLVNLLVLLKNTEYYTIKHITYFLNVALKSVNKFKVKVNIDKIKERMQILNLNQSKLANKIGVTRQAISNIIIRKQTSQFTIKEIACALRCEENEITITRLL